MRLGSDVAWLSQKSARLIARVSGRAIAAGDEFGVANARLTIEDLASFDLTPPPSEHRPPFADLYWSPVLPEGTALAFRLTARSCSRVTA
jgi:hypothetical protein